MLLFGHATFATPPATPPPPMPATLHGLIARNREALGYLPAAGATWSGTIDENGVSGAFAITADRAGRYRLTVSLPLSSRSEGDDGAHAWTQDQNGNVQIRPEGRLRSLGARLLGFNALFADPHFDGTLVGTDAVDGKPVYKVSTTLGRGTILMYVDLKSALLDRVDLSDETVRYADYRRFFGLVLPTSVSEAQTGSTVLTKIAKFDLAATGKFSIPVSRQPAFPTGHTEVDQQYDSVGGLIVVGAHVNGRPARFLVDSGSTSSVIDSGSVSRLGLPTAGSATVEGASVLTGAVARADELDVGGLTFRPFVFDAVPLSLPGPIAHNGIDGVLGYDFLAQLVTRFALGRGDIRFIQPASFTYTGNGSVLPMDTSSRVPHIATTIGRDDKVTLQVDSGSDASVVLFAEFADAHMGDFTTPGNLEQDYARGAGGAFPVRFASLDSLNLGAYSLPNVLTQIIVRPTGAFSPIHGDGFIGVGTLGSFSAVLLDYPGNRIIFER